MRGALLGCLALAALPPAAWGQGAEIGRREFLAGCAQCHGLTGQGDGILTPYLNPPAPDLTTIARDNDGIFPVGVLYEIIEGGGSTSAHGSSDMPAWGDRYSVEAYTLLGWPHEPEDREAFIRARILALVEYIASIQVE